MSMSLITRPEITRLRDDEARLRLLIDQHDSGVLEARYVDFASTNPRRLCELASDRELSEIVRPWVETWDDVIHDVLLSEETTKDGLWKRLKGCNWDCKNNGESLLDRWASPRRELLTVV